MLPCPRRRKPARRCRTVQRSQYFARIDTWDREVDTQRLYWSEAIYGMFGFQAMYEARRSGNNHYRVGQ
ncbi:hypothetical protein EX349_24570 [Pseudomonas protegens]|nr:hypothetical protein [Pseudomonas protegens]APC21056.1 hypothetical protein BME99_13035 [Pseudomonas protegens]NAN54387.1 hypothetical protein [Pseudomonas protegens]NUE78393.1 hypothetical protein [Pseudomonas protegens]